MTESKHFCFLLDVSGSMYGNRLSKAKETLIKTINNTSDQHLITLITFDDQAKTIFSARLSKKLKEIDFNTEFIQSITTGGTTALWKTALETVINNPLTDHKQVLFIFTDGQDNASDGITQEQVTGLCNEKNVSMEIIGIELQATERDTYTSATACVSSNQRGYTQVDDVEELEECMDEVFCLYD
jgi:Ca-activated chloride channel family protein